MVAQSLPVVSTWCGRPVTELTREELLTVVEYMGRELERLREEHMKIARHVNYASYLSEG